MKKWRCPICNTLMKEGKIQAWDTICWLPYKENRSFLFSRFSTGKRGIVLSWYNALKMFSGAEVPAYYCPNCRKIIIEVPRDDERL